MKALNETTINLRAVGITMTLAVLTITVMAVAFAARPTQAQSPAPNLNDGKYADPQPCGLNVSDVPDDPDGQFSEGHVALFDAYWDYNTQTLNNNLCPPLAVHNVVTDFSGTRVETTRKESNIDVNTTVFHAGDEFKATVVDTEAADYNASDYTGKRTIDRAKYPFLPPAGTEVWWLKQDDPIAEAAEPEGDEEPELVLGLSAGLFKRADWFAETCPLQGDCTEVPPLQYEFEAERDPEGNVIPFVVFKNDGTIVWDSRNADTNSIPLYPGKYDHYNWVFFPGPGQSHTYVLEVHIKGHVRTKPAPGITPEGWQPLTWPKNGPPYDPSNQIALDSINKVVTSEVVKQQYTIHVGPLTLNDPPRFLVKRSVNENPSVGDAVGDPVWVYDPDDNGTTTLAYKLSGPGHSHFSVDAAAGGAQIRVAGNGDLDHEIRSSYLLALEVSDGKNHENGADASVDDAVWVEIEVKDVTETEKATVNVLEVSTSTNSEGHTRYHADLWASIGDLPEGATNLQVKWTISEYGGSDQILGQYGDSLRQSYTFVSGNDRRFKVDLRYDQGGQTHTFSSEWVDVTWPSDNN